jgi:hypothetical protein
MTSILERGTIWKSPLHKYFFKDRSSNLINGDRYFVERPLFKCLHLLIVFRNIRLLIERSVLNKITSVNQFT